MRFENSFWRTVVCASLLAGSIGFAACNKTSTETPAPAPATSAPSSSASAKTDQAGNTPASIPAPTVALATPAPVSVPAAPAVPGPTPIPMEGKDFDVSLLGGSKMKLSKLLNRKKIVVVNFWATWCGPCRKEIPDLITLTKNYEGKDVEIYGLSVEDPAQAMTLVKDFTKQNQINYKIGFAPMPMFLMFNGARPGGPIPQTFIFGKDGKLLYHIPGMRPAYKDYVQQAIDIALKS